jgi:uncharacterized delta-60 repeat protein
VNHENNYHLEIRGKNMKLFIIIMLTFSFSLNLLLSKPGDLDSSFGKNGSVTYKLPEIPTYIIQRARIDKDGKIILAGSAGNGYLGFFLLKINDNGLIDSSFGTNGYVFTKLDIRQERLFDLQLLNDGSMIAAGYADREEDNVYSADFALVRYSQDGRLDLSFGKNGYTFTDFDKYHDFGTSLVILKDNKIILSGYSGHEPTYDFAMARYMPDGSMDSSFGNEGKVKTDLGYNDFSNSMIVQPDGKIVLGGYSIINGTSRFTLARYNSDGSLDSTFGKNGLVTTAIRNYDVGVSLSYLNTNKLLMTGYTRTDTYHQIALVRYNIDGLIDSSFGIDGFSVNHIGKGTDYSYDMTFQNDEKILVCGSSSDGDPTDMILARYNTNGFLDSTFGDGGRVITNIDYHSERPYNSDKAESIVIDKNGRILLAGSTLYVYGKPLNLTTIQSLCFRRFLTEFSVGIVDDISDNNDIFIYPNPISFNASIKFELIKDEYIDIALYDLNGNLIKYYAKSLFMEKGTHSYEIHLVDTIVPGEYFINISANNYNRLIKIIKQE